MVYHDSESSLSTIQNYYSAKKSKRKRGGSAPPIYDIDEEYEKIQVPTVTEHIHGNGFIYFC